MIMRTTTLIFVLTLCCTLLMGCKSPTSPLTQEEEKLVGKYYVTMSKDMEKTDEAPAMSVMLEGYTQYGSDRTCGMEGTAMLAIKALDELKQLTVTLEYSITEKGTWKIKDGYIEETPDPESVEWKFVKSNAETEEAKRFVKLLYTNTPVAAFKMKELFMRSEDSNAKIIELTDEKLVVEQDGEQMTMIRKK
ncbi:hypothetical protein Bache_0341 [Bacteroides helcogenes P 36-108]|uniref:Lipocalin-like domain-containing protein n=2 Tax=Bacteroides helcogenes TaxID=290053 RepID=E6SUF2_BACT6|nr:hypothetical protein Bache_0341 [Bacteroides helcogenes P 36-108]